MCMSIGNKNGIYTAPLRRLVLRVIICGILVIGIRIIELFCQDYNKAEKGKI